MSQQESWAAAFIFLMLSVLQMLASFSFVHSSNRFFSYSSSWRVSLFVTSQNNFLILNILAIFFISIIAKLISYTFLFFGCSSSVFFFLLLCSVCVCLFLCICLFIYHFYFFFNVFFLCFGFFFFNIYLILFHLSIILLLLVLLLRLINLLLFFSRTHTC